MNVVRGPQLDRLLGSWQATKGKRPDYVALAAAIRNLLLNGRLALGVRLPAERELAAALGVSRTTVTAAYQDLRTSGHLASRRGAGSTTTLPEGQRISTFGLWTPADEPDVLDLSTAALPAPPELAAAAAAALADLPHYASGTGYHPSGLPVLRERVAAAFTARGLPTVVDQILITGGVAHATDLILRLSVQPGQTVLAESPTYPNALVALRSHRTRLVTDNLDPMLGWDPDLLVGAVRANRPTVAYLIPEFHNPTGHQMPLELREKLVAAAHRAGTDLIIDESFVDLTLDASGLPPVGALDRHARVLTVGGMSKPFWGGLRVGWIRAAAPVIARLSAVRVAADMAGPVLDQLVAAHLLDRADQVIPARQTQLRARRDTLVAALRQTLPSWSFRVPGGGVSLWVELDAPVSTALAEAAAAHGVRLAPGPAFGAAGTLERFVRLPFTLPEPALVDAVARLATAAAGLTHAQPHRWSAPTLVA